MHGYWDDECIGLLGVIGKQPPGAADHFPAHIFVAQAEWPTGIMICHDRGILLICINLVLNDMITSPGNFVLVYIYQRSIYTREPQVGIYILEQTPLALFNTWTSAAARGGERREGDGAYTNVEYSYVSSSGFF